MSSDDVEKLFLKLRDNYQSAKKLMEENHDIVSDEKFKSMKKAEGIFQEILIQVKKIQSSDTDINFRVLVVSALINYESGMISMKCGKSRKAQDYFETAHDAIKSHNMKPECITLYICLLNEIAALQSKRNDCLESIQTLLRVRNHYKNYDGKCIAVAFDDLFFSKEQRKTKKYSLFDEDCANSNIVPNDKTESVVKLCFTNLQEQLKYENYDPIDWSRRCVTLSVYFIQRNIFPVARYFLSCANRIVANFESSHKKEEYELLKPYTHVKAHISYNWAMYGIELLQSGIKKKMGAAELFVDFGKNYRLLKSNQVKEYESKITCTCPADFSDAKPIFKFALEHLNSCRPFYVIDKYPLDFILLFQNHSRLYESLTYYDCDSEDICKMHKRRIDLLEDALKNNDIRSYHLAHYRKVLKELTQIYGIMVSLKRKIYQSKNQESCSYNVNKINFLIDKAIGYHKLGIESFTDTSKKLPEPFPEESARQILLAHYNMAEFYLELIIDVKTSKLYFVRAKEILKFIMDYIERNPSHEKFIENELPYIRELSSVQWSELESEIWLE